MQHYDGIADVAETAFVRPLAPSYSTRVAEAVTGPPQRGLVHSVFRAAANIVFPGAFVLSLNTADSPRMPNGIQLPAIPGMSPLLHLRAGMPVLLGAQRLCIQPLDYVLDLSSATQWDPHIEAAVGINVDVVDSNIEWLRQYILKKEDGRMPGAARYITGGKEDGRPQGATPRHPVAPVPTMNRPPTWSYIVGTGDEMRWRGAPGGRPSSPAGKECEDSYGHLYSSVDEMAQALCGRGRGLTPEGDDMLAGWMAMGWLVRGGQADFLEACREIVEVAQRQTHLLSQCWLEYAARGDVAEPIARLLYALTREDQQNLFTATEVVLAMGATSGYNVVQGILLQRAMYTNQST